MIIYLKRSWKLKYKNMKTVTRYFKASVLVFACFLSYRCSDNQEKEKRSGVIHPGWIRNAVIYEVK